MKRTLKYIVPLLVILLMTTQAFGAYKSHKTTRAAAVTGPTYDYMGNYVRLTYVGTTSDSMGGVAAGNLYDTNTIFPAYSTCESAKWENAAPGLDISSYAKIRGWVYIADSTMMSDSAKAASDTMIILWETSLDNKYWYSLDAITRGDTLAMPTTSNKISELPWCGAGNNSGTTYSYATQTGAPTIGKYLRILVKTASGLGGTADTDTNQVKWRVVLEAEKK